MAFLHVSFISIMLYQYVYIPLCMNTINTIKSIVNEYIAGYRCTMNLVWKKTDSV